MILYESHRSNLTNYVYHQHDHNLNFGPHLHNSFEFIYVSEGELTCRIMNQDWTIHAHEAIIILSNQLHSYTTPVDSRSYLCVFSNDLIKHFMKMMSGLTFENPVFPFDHPEWIDALKKPKNIFEEKAILYHICSLAYHHLKPVKSTNADSELLSHIILYVQDHYAEPITLRKVAKDLGYNYYYLSNFINKNLNMTFKMFLSRHRIEYANYLLQEENSPISEIALKCGFNSIRNFNRLYQSLHGYTPRDFLNRKKQVVG